ncbi:MAG: hypothetical protein ACI4EN_00095 [Butyrivibrio sp.]
MKEKVCCICDTDEKYGLRLAEYINSEHLLPFHVVVYTSWDALAGHSDRYDIELLIVGVPEEDPVIESLNPGVVVYLTDCIAQEDENCIFRYQPADRLAKKIMAFLPEYGFTRITKRNKTNISCIYSPATKCFKTTLSICLALRSSVKGRSLFISLEQFAGLSGLLSSSEGGLSAALYYFKSGQGNALGKIISCTGQTQGFDYFYPVTCPEDAGELTEKELTEFLNLIAEGEIYDYIWIDTGNVYSSPWILMDICDRVIMPVPLDYMGHKKIMELENYLIMSGREELKDKIEKISIPYEERMAGYEITFDRINQSQMIRITDKILEGYTDE